MQTVLIPQEKLKLEAGIINTADYRADVKDCFVSQGFMGSVDIMGVIEPVVIRHSDSKLMAGKKRIYAALAADIAQVNCVFVMGDCNPSVIALIENMQRVRDDVEDFLHLSKLLDEGHKVADILIACNSKDRIRFNKLIKINTKLIKELLKGWMNRTICSTIAYTCAGFSVNDQEKLLKVYSKKGTLTDSDLAKVRGGKTEELLWQELVVKKLNEIIEILPQEDTERRSVINRMILGIESEVELQEYDEVVDGGSTDKDA